MSTMAKELLGRLDRMKTVRVQRENRWQDIVQLVRPITVDFRGNSNHDRRFDNIYDGTAPDANEELASGLHSYLTNPTDRWFSLETDNMEELEHEPDALLWLEQVADRIYRECSNEDSNFNSAMHEAYLDLGAFGNCVLFNEYNPKLACVVFRSFPIASCWWDENYNGRVDTLYRECMMTKRQCLQEFGALPPKMADKQNADDKQFCVIHCVFPRADRKHGKLDPKNKAFASFYICKDTEEEIRESGFNSFPYQVSRWMRFAGNPYGMGPGEKALPDIKMLNALEKVVIKGAEKIIDPPLMVPHEGFIGQIRTSPGALLFKQDAMGEDIVPLQTNANIPVGLELSDRKRDQIKQAFYVDWLRMEKTKIEMTATEVMDRREEKLRMMAPMLGRQQGELLGPLIQRIYELLEKQDEFPEYPAALANRPMKVVYISPAARAQTGVRAIGISRLIQEVAPLASIDPSALDAIDVDRVVQELALARGTTRRIIRSPEAIEEIRSSRAQQQQAQEMAQTLEPVSKSIKNIADAQKTGMM